MLIPEYEPSPEQISEAAAKIRAKWSATVRRTRNVYGDRRVRPLEPIEAYGVEVREVPNGLGPET